MTQISQILENLHQVKKNGHGWSACCPAHEDKVQSLSVSIGDDERILIHCHAGCETHSILNVLGFEMKDLFNISDKNTCQKRQHIEKQNSPLVPSIPLDLVEQNHKALTEAQRAYMRDKRMLSDAVIDRYKLGIMAYGNELRVAIPVFGVNNEVNDIRRWLPPEKRTEKTPKILHWAQGYGKARLYPIDQLEKDQLVLCAGELDALAAISQGIPAITATCGEAYWSEELSLPFKNKIVTILLDHDETGRKGAQKRAELLLKAGANVKIASWSDERPEGWDITDELQKYGSESLKKIIREARSRIDTKIPQPLLTCLSDVEPEEISWIWSQRLARGKLNLIIGDPGLGKSFITLDIASRVSQGRDWPDGTTSKQGDVILLSAEDGVADTIRPRIDSLKGDVKKIHVLRAIIQDDKERPFCLASDLPALEASIKQTNAQLVIVDPLSAYLGKTESYKDSEVRGLLAPLAAIGEKLGVGILAVMHLTKDAQKKAIYRAPGSIAFVGAARIVLAVAKDPDDEFRRLISPVKTNICVAPPTLAFSFNDGVLVWEPDPVAEVDVDRILSGPSKDEQDDRNDASDFLTNFLAGREESANEVFKAAKLNGISERTLNRVKKKLGIIVRRVGYIGSGGSWHWSLPNNTAKAATKIATNKQVATLGKDIEIKGEITRSYSKIATSEQVATLEAVR